MCGWSTTSACDGTTLLNRLDDALLTLSRARERELDFDSFVLFPYLVAYLKGTEDELSRAADVARKSLSAGDMMLHIEALALACAGRLQEARRMSALPVDMAQRAGRRERAGLFEAGRAVWEAFYGNATSARQSAAKALELGKGGREVDYAAAFALALAGDQQQSRELIEGLGREYPAQAAAEFQKILDHRSIVLVDPMDALARLQLARALAGDTAQAKNAYNDLFALWKNADPDLALLKEARAEYGRLR